jgi:hypothetical protein
VKILYFYTLPLSSLCGVGYMLHFISNLKILQVYNEWLVYNLDRVVRFQLMINYIFNYYSSRRFRLSYYCPLYVDLDGTLLTLVI